jgi:hypothetical protein
MNGAFPFVHVRFGPDPDTGRLYYGKSFMYPLVAAPFVWLWGTSGFLVLPRAPARDSGVRGVCVHCRAQPRDDGSRPRLRVLLRVGRARLRRLD